MFRPQYNGPINLSVDTEAKSSAELGEGEWCQRWEKEHQLTGVGLPIRILGEGDRVQDNESFSGLSFVCLFIYFLPFFCLFAIS